MIDQSTARPFGGCQACGNARAAIRGIGEAVTAMRPGDVARRTIDAVKLTAEAVRIRRMTGR
jgi:hypothetical protein